MAEDVGRSEELLDGKLPAIGCEWSDSASLAEVFETFIAVRSFRCGLAASALSAHVR